MIKPEVLDVRLGRYPVLKVMFQEEQIWPKEKSAAEKLMWKNISVVLRLNNETLINTTYDDLYNYPKTMFKPGIDLLFGIEDNDDKDFVTFYCKKGGSALDSKTYSYTSVLNTKTLTIDFNTDVANLICYENTYLDFLDSSHSTTGTNIPLSQWKTSSKLYSRSTVKGHTVTLDYTKNAPTYVTIISDCAEETIRWAYFAWSDNRHIATTVLSRYLS